MFHIYRKIIVVSYQRKERQFSVSRYNILSKTQDKRERMKKLNAVENKSVQLIL